MPEMVKAPAQEVQNDIGLDGIEFIEFASPDPDRLQQLFLDFGFSRHMRHASMKIDLFSQNDIHFLLNREPGTFAASFTANHGPSICSMGWRVKSARVALEIAKSRGARVCERPDLIGVTGDPIPAVYGIGESLIYLVETFGAKKQFERMGFMRSRDAIHVEPKGFTRIDHLTNNVHKGTMKKWADFYKSVFGFTEVRYFDIKGVQTGLQSFALRSPCGKFCIPINEADEAKSQINEYLEEYRGPGIQHLAFLTDDILASLRKLDGTSIRTLDIDDEYYQSVFDRVPGVMEDPTEIQRRNVLVDGDKEGYLLQLFTQNLIGPIFIEIIQRKNHLSFGEGNFQALFRSIERDQAKRGVFSGGST